MTLTPEDVEDARRIAADALSRPHRVDTIGILAKAVLALSDELDNAKADVTCEQHSLTPSEHKIGDNTFGACNG